MKPVVFIASRLFDLEGAFRIEPSDRSELGETRRRVSRVATLDGGVAVNDFGVSAGDRKVTLNWKPTSIAVEAKINALVETHTQVSVSMAGGVYLAAPEYYRSSPSESRMGLLILEKLSA